MNEKIVLSKEQTKEITALLKRVNWQIPNREPFEWWNKQNLPHFLRCKKCQNTMGFYPMMLHLCKEQHNLTIEQALKSFVEV